MWHLVDPQIGVKEEERERDRKCGKYQWQNRVCKYIQGRIFLLVY